MIMLKNEIPGLKLVRYGESPNEITCLEGEVELLVWKEFQDRSGPYASKPENGCSSGMFRIDVGGDMVVNEPAVSFEHLSAYEQLIRDQAKIQAIILAGLFSWYNELRPRIHVEVEALGWRMPPVNVPGAFKELIGLSVIHLMNVHRDGVAYVGYEFGCSWDEEHGSGVMMHKNRIVEIGDGNTAFLSWKAEADLDR